MFSSRNLNQYKIFYTVAKLGNISHAAEKLYISQPAISKAISKLEESLGVKIFIRNHRGVILTEEGEILYKHITAAFDAINAGEEHIKRINELGIGQIKIGASTTLAKYMLLPYLAKFVEKNPHIRITLECQSSTHTTKLLDKNSIDIALIVKPETIHNFDFYTIGEVEYIFVATKTYLDNLYKRENAENLSAHELEMHIFKTANLMLLDKENISRQYVDNYLKENNIEISQILEVSNMDLLIEFAKTGLGVACVIKEFVLDDLNNGTIIEITLEKPIPPKSIGYAFSKTIPLSKSVEKFVNFYKSH